MARKLTLVQAKAIYTHRFTMEHTPRWARGQYTTPDGAQAYYAPHYASDQEWYDNTVFPGEAHWLSARSGYCHSEGQTWPLGKALRHPHTR